MDSAARWHDPDDGREDGAALRALLTGNQVVDERRKHHRRSALSLAIRLHSLRSEWIALLLPAGRNRTCDSASGLYCVRDGFVHQYRQRGRPHRDLRHEIEEMECWS